jgi:hypothetical protein
MPVAGALPVVFMIAATVVVGRVPLRAVLRK